MGKFLKALRIAGDCAEIIVAGSILVELDLLEKATQLFKQFEPKKEENLTILENLGQTTITEQQFCQIIGRLRLYQALPTEQHYCKDIDKIILR